MAARFAIAPFWYYMFELHLPERKALRGPSAFLTVQEGCDKFCAFCVVPYTRGAEVSRPVDRVLAEQKQLEKVTEKQNTAALVAKTPAARL